MTDRHNKYMIRIINSLLVIMFFLCGCTQKPPEVEPDDPPVEPETISEDELRDFPEGYPVISDEPGNSAAFAYSPLEGFYVEAEENAFWQDTNITMKPAETVTEDALNSINELVNDGVYPIGVYEIDAGLDDHDVIPGEYKVSVDPAVFDVDPSLYPCIRAYRIGDDGGYYECATEYTDGKIVYHANQNSVVEMAVALAIIYPFAKNLYDQDDQRALEYFYKSNKKSWYASERTNEYATYRLLYSMEDMDKDLGAISTRLEEISQGYAEKAEQLFKEHWEKLKKADQDIPDMIAASKKTMEQIVEEAINNDDEFQQLKKQLYTPEIITRIAEYADLAFAYLSEQEKVKMPLFVVDIICTPRSGNPSQAEATARKVLHAGYIELNLRQVLQGNNDAKYNLLLTMTHELLHVCQERYRYFFADSVRYDEMVAANMEQRSLDYYVSQGLIPEGLNLEMSPTDRWCTLKNSINSKPGEEENANSKPGKETKTKSKSDDNYYVELMKMQGYFLSNFIEYLVERTGKRPNAGKLMNARDSIIEPGVTEPLKGAFEIDEKEIDAHFTTFVRKNREKLAFRYNNGNYEFFYKEPTILEKGSKYRIDLEHFPVEQGNIRSVAYSAYITGFKQPDTEPMILLLAIDDDIHYNLPELLVIPLDKYKTFRKGAYIGAPDKNTLMQNQLHRNILNIHGYFKYKTDEKPSGYTVYALNKTGEVTFSEDKDNLIIQMPKNSVAAADRVVEGYLLKLEIEGGETIEKELGQEYFEKEYTIKKKDIYGDKNIKEPLSVSATLCEYVKDKEGNRMLGETSDLVSYVINEGAVEDTGDMVWVLDTLVYQDHWDNYDTCHEEPDYSKCDGSDVCAIGGGYCEARDASADDAFIRFDKSSYYISSPNNIDYELNSVKLPPSIVYNVSDLVKWGSEISDNNIVHIDLYLPEVSGYSKKPVVYSDGKKFGKNGFDDHLSDITQYKTIYVDIYSGDYFGFVYRAISSKDAATYKVKHVDADPLGYENSVNWQ